MATPLAAYSLSLRLELGPGLGLLGRLVVGIEGAGATVERLETGRPEPSSVDVVVHCTDEGHMAAVVEAVAGVFRGALDAGATTITDAMEVAASGAIASCVSADDMAGGVVVPSVFDSRVAVRVAEAVADAARADGVVRP